MECDSASELCCEAFGGETGKCVGKSAKERCGTVEVLWKACDELGDCAKGEVCCYAPRSDPTVYAMNVCRKGSCGSDEPEVCLPGGTCSKGKHCKVGKKGDSAGWCGK